MKNILQKGESVVTAFAECVSGPGWSNTPIWVVVRDQNKGVRLECIQPENQTAEMLTLFAVSAAAHTSMTSAVVTDVSKKRKLVRQTQKADR